VNVLVVRDEPNLGSLGYPSLWLAIFIILLVVAAVEGREDALAECLHEALVIGFLRDVDDKQPAEADGLSGPVLLGDDELDGTAVKLRPLVSI
jgi:hypothetical protein